MKELKISREGKLYKLFSFLSNIFPFSLYIKQNSWHDEDISSFSDVCTFCRHVFYSIFIALPFFVIWVVSAAAIIFGALLYIPFTGFSGETVGVYSLWGYACIIPIYLIFCYLQYRDKHKVPFYEEEKVEKEKGIIGKTVEIMREKNKKFCTRIKIED